MSEAEASSLAGRAIVARPRPRNRADAITAQIRDLISLHGLKPGDRLPPEWLSEEFLQASKGTVREAMKALQTQGLIRTRTGPGGGAFVTALSGEQAIDLLSNLFLFERPSIADIYALRKQLEPELAAGLAGRLDEAALEELRATIRLYEREPETVEEEFQQRLSELDFHSVLASFSENRLLAFVCVFLQRLLRDMAVCRAIYMTPNPALRETALNYQVQLIRVLKAGDAQRARELMRQHMEEAERYMLERAAIRQHEQGRAGERHHSPPSL
ncbi:MAG TPA: FCD domain-containing protein [Kiloniellales bacterium]|nr:FCD domain-containing protein [Kiloniellales bacterium]